MENLLDLFLRCLNAKYVSTPKNGNYAIEREPDTLYLLFEHSRGVSDWKSNFNFPAKPYKRMDSVWFCHRGFLEVFNAMRDELEAKVKRALISKKIKNIVCVGYSHGGPLALLCTENFAYIYNDKLNVSGYGFGSPRVLWGIVPKDVKKRLENFTVVRNIPDIVTHVPPVSLGYRHVGKLKEIGERGKYSPIKAHFEEAYIAELRREVVEDI